MVYVTLPRVCPGVTCACNSFPAELHDFTVLHDAIDLHRSKKVVLAEEEVSPAAVFKNRLVRLG
jgi:hypothetical protein